MNRPSATGHVSSPLTSAKNGVAPYPQEDNQACLAFTSSAEPTDGLSPITPSLKISSNQNPAAGASPNSGSARTNSRKTWFRPSAKDPMPRHAVATALYEYASAYARTKLRQSQILNHNRSCAGMLTS